MLYFDSYFTAVCSQVPHYQQATIGLDKTWRRTDNNPSSEPTIDLYADAYLPQFGFCEL